MADDDVTDEALPPGFHGMPNGDVLAEPDARIPAGWVWRSVDDVWCDGGDMAVTRWTVVAEVGTPPVTLPIEVGLLARLVGDSDQLGGYDKPAQQVTRDEREVMRMRIQAATS